MLKDIICGSCESGDTIFVNVDKDSYRLGDDSKAADQLLGQNVTLVNEDTTEVSSVDTGVHLQLLKQQLVIINISMSRLLVERMRIRKLSVCSVPISTLDV